MSFRLAWRSDPEARRVNDEALTARLLYPTSHRRVRAELVTNAPRAVVAAGALTHKEQDSK